MEISEKQNYETICEVQYFKLINIAKLSLKLLIWKWKNFEFSKASQA